MTDEKNELAASTSKGHYKTVGEFKFNVDDIIGKGSFATVYLGYELTNKTKKFAIKEIEHRKLEGKQRDALDKEIEIHKAIDNPAIIKLHAIRRTPNHYYLILEYCEGKDLHTYLKSKGKLSEMEVQYMMHSLVPAFQYLYEHKVIHRDIKLKNLLRAQNKDYSIIKVCDFGTARYNNN
jgi:serine/threonine protein kinase